MDIIKQTRVFTQKALADKRDDLENIREEIADLTKELRKLGKVAPRTKCEVMVTIYRDYPNEEGSEKIEVRRLGRNPIPALQAAVRLFREKFGVSPPTSLACEISVILPQTTLEIPRDVWGVEFTRACLV